MGLSLIEQKAKERGWTKEQLAGMKAIAKDVRKLTGIKSNWIEDAEERGEAMAGLYGLSDRRTND